MKNRNFILLQGLLGVVIGFSQWAMEIFPEDPRTITYLTEKYTSLPAVDAFMRLVVSITNFLPHGGWIWPSIIGISIFLSLFLLIRQLVPYKNPLFVQCFFVILTGVTATCLMLYFTTTTLWIVGLFIFIWPVFYYPYLKLNAGTRLGFIRKYSNNMKILFFGLLNGIFQSLVILGAGKIHLFLFYLIWSVVGGGRFHRELYMLFADLPAPFIVLTVGIGSAPAFAADALTFYERFNKAKIPLIVLLILGLVIGPIYYLAIRNCDWNKSFEQATGIPDTKAPEPMTLISLTFDKNPKMRLKTWPLMTNTSGVFSPIPFYDVHPQVPTTTNNAEALKKFLLDPLHRNSCYWNQAFDVVNHIDGTLWNQRDWVHCYVEVSLSPNAFQRIDDISSFWILTWIYRTSPLDEFCRKEWETLSDPTRFNIKGATTRSMALGWLRYGDLSKAQYWKQKYIESGALTRGYKEIELSMNKILTQGIKSGIVMGNIALKGLGIEKQVKICLVNEYLNTKTNGIGGGDLSLPPDVGFNGRIVDSQYVGKDGQFRFENLSDGFYSISLLVPSSVIPADTKDLVVKRHPGVITLTKQKPVFNAGKITLEIPKK